MFVNRRIFLQSLVGSFSIAQARAQQVNKFAEQLRNGEFNWFPERSVAGPVLIIVSVPDQKVHVYRNGIRIAASTCSTGKPGHGTPTGVFTILQKDKNHRSSTYNNAPMPNMNRLTWSGIALHAGNLPGYPASHGCVRLPIGFSQKLFEVTRLGMTVVIADEDSAPASVVHPGLVLGDYARREYAGVDLSIKAKQYAQRDKIDQPQTSIVVSGKDKRVTVWKDHDIVAQGKVKIADEAKPIPDRAYSLVSTQDGKSSLEWSVVGFGKAKSFVGNDSELMRIRTSGATREVIRRSLHHGAVLVTTHERNAALNRTKPDFVVFDSLY